MSVHSIAAVLGGQVPPGARTTIQGWVRTRRDSRAGLPFVAVHDGSCFEPLQVIAPVELPNYASEVTHLTAGCAIRVTGELVVSPGKDQDLQSEHERYLAEDDVGRLLVLMNYPRAIKSFYMRLNDDGRTVAAMDVLAPGIGDIIGGSQREERLGVLDARLDALGMNKNAYNWYRDLRRYGSVPHAGFGLGFERTVSYVTGMANVRDVIPFPRTPRSADF